MAQEEKIRVLVAKPGLDGHDVGAKAVARALMEAGFEVVYTGLKKSPEEIVQRACEEKVDVLGLSILSGSHIPICQQIKTLLDKHEVPPLLWVVGGNIPSQDHDELRTIGVDGVFAVGSSLQDIIDFIHERTS